MAQVLSMLAFFEGNSFTDLFAEMTPIVYILFILGIIFCCIEIFTPGFGFFGGTGAAMLIAALIVRWAQGGDFLMFIWMLLIAIGTIGISVVVMLILLKNGKLKSAIFNVGSSVPTAGTEGTQDFSHLLGEVGVTENFLRPVGNVRFSDGTIIDVVARNSFIDIGMKVKVISVEGQVVKVEQINEN